MASLPAAALASAPAPDSPVAGGVPAAAPTAVPAAVPAAAPAALPQAAATVPAVAPATAGAGGPAAAAAPHTAAAGAGAPKTGPTEVVTVAAEGDEPPLISTDFFPSVVTPPGRHLDTFDDTMTDAENHQVNDILANKTYQQRKLVLGKGFEKKHFIHRLSQACMDV